MLPLEIFPPGALASSVIATVWVGVWVVALANLRLGWVFSGLVVPGYLAPLVLLKPWAAAVIVVEGVVAFVVVWVFSEVLSRAGAWSSLFGRDRFFALILASVGVRLAFDGWLLPELGQRIEALWDIDFDYRGNLHSFGLVIVALVANQFWKTGLRHGLPPLLIVLAATVLLVRFGLMEFTNFGLSALSYLYDDLATSILATPKAYIVLVTAAFLASRMNLHYGWDFNGILIPALLALQWYDPLKILTSFGEAFLILGLAVLALRVPPFNRVTIEGARKLLLFFNISFLYKLLLGWTLVTWFPAVKPTDLFAFGYLLSTLLAVKMHDKGIAVRLTRATLQTSLTAVAVASVLGLGLSLLPSLRAPAQPGGPAAAAVRVQARPETLPTRLLADKIQLYRARIETSKPPSPVQIETFSRAVGLLADAGPAQANSRQSGAGNDPVAEAEALLESIGYELELLQGRWYYLREAGPARGWGLFALDSQNDGGLLVELPWPLERSNLVSGGIALLQSLDARALALGGSVGSRDALQQQDSLFHAFHRVLDRRNTLQLRAYTKRTRRAVLGRNAAAPDEDALPNLLWVKGTLPRGLDLPRLRDLVVAPGETLAIRWDRPPFANLQRRTSREGFAELLLGTTALRRLMFSPLLEIERRVAIEERVQRIDGYLQERLLLGRDRIAERGSELYVPPDTEALLYLDDEVLTPLFDLIGRGYRDGNWTPEGTDELASILAAANVFGYRLTQYRHTTSGREYLILAEPDETPTRHYWGTYLFRLGPANPYQLQVPRPLYELEAFELGVALFERLEARSLLLGGTHPEANRDRSADLVRSPDQRHLFNLVSQVGLRESGETPELAIQVRAFGFRSGEPLPDADMLLSFADGAARRERVSPLGQGLMDRLETDGWHLKLVDGSAETAGYQVVGLPQARYLPAATNKEMVLLWVSPLARASFRQQGEGEGLTQRIEALGIPGRDQDLYAAIEDALTQVPASGANVLPDRVDQRLRGFLDNGDLVQLSALMRDIPELSLERVVDRDSRRNFLLVRHRGALRRVVNATPRLPPRWIGVSAQDIDRAAVKDFVATRSACLSIDP